MAPNGAQKKIAIVGAGISGIVTAYILGKAHDVTLIEANDYLGGHTNTIVIDRGPDEGTAVDTGFIVCNQRNYPNFYKFLASLEIKLRNSDMTFGFHCTESKLSYNGPTLSAFLNEPRNLLNFKFVKMLYEQRKFNSAALRDLETNTIGDKTLGDYLRNLNASQFFSESYLIPLAAAIWSSPGSNIWDFPAATFLRFFDNHGMLDLRKIPQWQTVVGGSFNYVKAFERNFKGRIKLSSPVRQIIRDEKGIQLHINEANPLQFDAVVIATHADTALKLLALPTAEEQAYLSAWRYTENETILHTSRSVLPYKKGLWASWNYVRSEDSKKSNSLSITYYMNRLQGLSTEYDYFVTLNCPSEIPSADVVRRIIYHHPVYTSSSVSTQEKLRAINGQNNTFYCGSYLGYGFHEDGVNSALEVTKHFGLTL